MRGWEIKSKCTMKFLLKLSFGSPLKFMLFLQKTYKFFGKSAETLMILKFLFD